MLWSNTSKVARHALAHPSCARVRCPHLEVCVVYAEGCCALLHRQLPHVLLQVAGCSVAEVHRTLLRVLGGCVYGLQGGAGQGKTHTDELAWGCLLATAACPRPLLARQPGPLSEKTGQVPNTILIRTTANWCSQMTWQSMRVRWPCPDLPVELQCLIVIPSCVGSVALLLQALTVV